MEIPFGHGITTLEFEKDRPVRVVSPRNTPADAKAIQRAISNPVKFESFDSFLSEKRKLLVVVNDHTRPTPSLQVLNELPLKGKEVTTIIAGGTHRTPNTSELERIIGGAVPPYGGKVTLHNSRDRSALKGMGKTSRGTELFFNKLLFDMDGIIVVGSVEPHYFAGYTGGRKFLLPALAGYESIAMNHSLAAEESSRVLALDGNPVHDDFMEALNMFGRTDDIFSIQLVLNNQHHVSYASAGHIVESFNECVEHAKQIYAPTVPKKVDIVISVNKPPLDIDLYQSQKAIDNVKLAVKDNGVIILVSSCREGIGDRSFYDMLSPGSGDLSTRAGQFGYHKAVKLRNLSKRVSIFVVSSLEPSIPSAIGLKSYQDTQSALEDASKLKGSDAEVLVVLDGAMTVPQPETN
jgi:nickel-dependent lactate racemase